MNRAVILCAGYGSRFLPVSRVVPKELLPLGTMPALDFVVQELVAAGVVRLLVVTSRRKRAIEDWFDRAPELEQAFGDNGEKQMWIRPPNLDVQFVRQKRMGGTGDALMLAADFAANEPVIVAYPDDLFGAPNVSSELIEAHERTGCSVLAVVDRSGTDVSRYGVIEGTPREDGLIDVKRIVEKPRRGQEPSSMVSLGRYLYTPEVFERIGASARLHEGDGELYPMDALNGLAAAGKLVATVVTAAHYDTGSPEGYLKTMVEVGLAHPETGEAFAEWLRERTGLNPQRP